VKFKIGLEITPGIAMKSPFCQASKAAFTVVLINLLVSMICTGYDDDSSGFAHML